MENPTTEENINLSRRHQLLCNSLGFEKILSYLSSADKANVRSVCNQWKVSSEAKWRSTSTFQINGVVVKHGDETWKVSRPIYLTLEEIVEQVLHVHYNIESNPMNMSEFPFRKLKINGNDHLGIGIMNDIETGFWNYFGPSLKSLHLNKVSMPPGGVTQLHRILCEFTPNLKEFEYTQVNIPILPEPVLLDEINHGIQPNLTSITINLEVWKYFNTYRALMQAYIDNIRAQPGHNDDQLIRQLGPRFMRIMNIFERDVPYNQYWNPRYMSEYAIAEFVRVQLHRLNSRREEAASALVLAPPPPGEPQFEHIFPMDWKLLFETFPNLKKISYDFGYCSPPEENAFELVSKLFLLDQIKWIGQVRNERPDTLNIDSWNGVLFGGDVIAKLCELALPLRSFIGRFKRTTESDFRNLVSSHGATLKELSIDTGSFTFTWLPAGLTYLELNRPQRQSLDFLEHVPNLETLIFKNNGDQNVAIFTESFGRQGAVRRLERMSEFRCEVLLEEDTFNIIVNLMPNLKKLSVGMDNSRWMIVSLVWDKLEYLEILQRQWTEHFILAEKSFIQVADRFQNLKTFVIEKGRKRKSTHFSDLSIYEGFMKMAQLQSLKIKFSPEVSDEAISALMESIPYLDI